VVGGYLIFDDNRQFSSRPSKKKNGSEWQSKSVSAVLKGKKRREKQKQKQNKTKQKRERISELPVLVISDLPVSGRYLILFSDNRQFRGILKLK
jgi:hypothetical protein